MPRYLVGGYLAEALNVPDSTETVVLRLGDGLFQTAPGRFHPWNRSCSWDEEFSICLDATAGNLASMRLEVLSLERGWLGQEVRRPLASGVLQLKWIHSCGCHFHPRMRLPMKRSSSACSSASCLSAGPVELHLCVYVLGPGDPAPEPNWLSTFASLPWAPLPKPIALKAREGPPLPSSACLEFTMVALWDLDLPEWKALNVDDLLVDLHFLLEAHGDVDELVFLEDSVVTEASTKWREIYPAPDGKVCLQLPRTHRLNVELPASCVSASLQIQVSVMCKTGSRTHEEVQKLEACMPLLRGSWPCLGDEASAERPVSMPLENFASGAYGKVPLFHENSRAVLGIRQMEGVESFAIPGAVGSMKCGYHLSRRSLKEKKLEPPVEDLPSTEEESEVIPEPEVDLARSGTAAAHTHDFGYQKWETFVQEMEGKPKKHAASRGVATEVTPLEDESDEEEENIKELVSAPSVQELPEQLKEATGPHFMLHLYVHDVQLLQIPQGDLELEVLLGSNLAFKLGQGRSPSGLRCQFRGAKELPIELPRHSRLQLRLRDLSSRHVLGSTVVDLQDRRLVESLRDKDELAECRQLWSTQLQSAGSLQMCVRLTPFEVSSQLATDSKLEMDHWPVPHQLDRAELRVILHEVNFSVASRTKEVLAAIELQLPTERLHRCRLPSPQYSDVRPCDMGLRMSFEWRFALSLKVLIPSVQKCLLISIFDAESWQLIGLAELMVDESLAIMDPVKARRFNDVPVWTRNYAGMQGSLSLSVSALPKNVAEQFPAPIGRAPCAVPLLEDKDPISVAQDFCAARLVCHPPPTSKTPLAPPWRRSARRRKKADRRRWPWALAALAFLASVALRKEWISHRVSGRPEECTKASPRGFTLRLTQSLRHDKK